MRISLAAEGALPLPLPRLSFVIPGDANAPGTSCASELGSDVSPAFADESAGGDAAVGKGRAISALRRRLNDTPQLLANIASALVAVGRAAAVTESARVGVATVLFAASGDVRGTWYDVVRRRFISTFDMSSEIESSGLGDAAPSNGGLSMNGSVIDGRSESAVVGDAFAVVAPDDATEPGNGGRVAGKRDEKERREAREPGRSGEGRFGACAAGPELNPNAPVPPALSPILLEDGVSDGRTGEVGAFGVVGEDAFSDGGAVVSSGTCTGACAGEDDAGGGEDERDPGDERIGSNGLPPGAAWARSLDKADGRAGGDEPARARTGNRCEVGGRVVPKDSSSSASGGPGGSGTVAGVSARRASLSADTFREEPRRFVGAGCVQSSTSSM